MRLIWILLLVLAGSLTGYLITRFERGDPLIQTRMSPVYVGSEHVHRFSVYDEGTGLESVRIWIQQREKAVDHHLKALWQSRQSLPKAICLA